MKNVANKTVETTKNITSSLLGWAKKPLGKDKQEDNVQFKPEPEDNTKNYQ